MATATRISTAERLGRWLGEAWHGTVHLDRRAHGWLLASGWAPGAAKTVLLVVKLVILGALAYVAFWLTLLLAVIALAARQISNSAAKDSEDESSPVWRDGYAGFGLYDKNEWRHDIGDPDKS